VFTVCEGFDHLCATVCPDEGVWVQCVCAYLRAGCVYGVCVWGSCVITWVWLGETNR